MPFIDPSDAAQRVHVKQLEYGGLFLDCAVSQGLRNRSINEMLVDRSVKQGMM